MNALSCNLASDQQGVPDSRPGTWGSAGNVDVPMVFVNVPAGKRVRVMRVYGDFVAWPHGSIVADSNAGVLASLFATSVGASPFVANTTPPDLPGARGCFMYIQGGVAVTPFRAPIDFDTSANGLLDADNKMWFRHAVYLNTTGVKIHMETTLIVVFQYE